LCETLGCPDVPDDPRFRGNAERVPRRMELHEILERETRRFSAAELMDKLREAGVPASTINTIDKVFVDEHVNLLGMFPPVAPDFRVPEMKFVDIPVTINGERSVKRLMPPRLGENTEDVLRAAGFSAEELRVLRSEKVIN
jgi:crotonobetainyl-CoA:carnitine CoA-transferase CaiB-like acyl-CoA transferase